MTVSSSYQIIALFRPLCNQWTHFSLCQIVSALQGSHGCNGWRADEDVVMKNMLASSSQLSDGENGDNLAEVRL